MEQKNRIDLSYFPGCSLKTTATENNQSLKEFCRKIGVNLYELKDWNCCGSSSTHSINGKIALDLASRNFSLVPKGQPLLVPCPSCILRLREAHHQIKQDKEKQKEYEQKWGKPFDPKLRIMHFLELLENTDITEFCKENTQRLKGFKFVVYYGCMLTRPNSLRHEKTYPGSIEKALSAMGATILPWPYKSRCCGSFLSVAKTDATAKITNEIVADAVASGADSIVTACAMCQLNLEVRCSLSQKLPVLHLTELLTLALGDSRFEGWFERHLVDPIPLLKSKGLLNQGISL
jgi:heterodisulfide reductase subunit B